MKELQYVAVQPSGLFGLPWWKRNGIGLHIRTPTAGAMGNTQIHGVLGCQKKHSQEMNVLHEPAGDLKFWVISLKMTHCLTVLMSSVVSSLMLSKC